VAIAVQLKPTRVLLALKNLKDLQFLKETETPMRNKQKSFSLIELLIVVAIILIIAAIAIPNLIRSKMAANEASAVATLRTINTAEVVYSSTYNNPAVFGTLPQLGSAGTAGANCTPAALQAAPPTSAGACLIDNALEVSNAAPGKSGYLLTLAVANGGYAGNNDPVAAGSTGTRQFFTDQTLVIRQKSGGAAGPGDPPI
jgi:type IV pilus assembly protein PilA